MEARLIVEYDRTGDILYIGKTTPYPEQESEELDYGMVARLNPQSGEVENLEILLGLAKMGKMGHGDLQAASSRQMNSLTG